MESKSEYLRLGRQSVSARESACDYTLPDYNPDVRRVLYTSARAVKGGSYSDGERAEASGSVIYDVIYLDTDGRLNHTDFSSDVEVSLPTSEMCEASAVELCLSGYTVKLNGPRRFSARATLEAELLMRESCTLDVEGDGFSGGTPETCVTQIGVATGEWAESPEMTLSEDLWERDGAMLDEVKILLTAADGIVASVRHVDDGVEVKGEIEITMLIESEGEMPELVRRSIPFTVAVEGITAKDGEPTLATVRITRALPTLVATEDGARASVEVGYVIDVKQFYNNSVSLIRDAYLCDRETKNEYGEFGYEELITSTIGTVKVVRDMPREELLSADTRNILYTGAAFRLDECHTSEHAVELSGRLRIGGVACEVYADGATSYTGVKLDLPVTGEIDVDRMLPESAEAACTATVTKLELTIDEERIYVDAELSVQTSVFAHRRQGCLRASVLDGGEIERDPSVVSVYYPESGESLFDVAKRYHTPLLTVASDNSLSENCLADPSSSSALAGVKKLIIR